MLIIRDILTAKPGQASKLAKLMKEVMGMDPNFKGRILTDLVASYNTVVIEAEVESLAAWEKQWEEMMKNPPPGSEKMSGYTDMYLTGAREIYRVW
jgi:hypothetical protein